MDIQRAARTATAAKVLADAARLEGNAARDLLGTHMRETGTERIRVTDEHGDNLGAVSLAKGRVSARVVDEAAFFAWVAKRYRSELEEVLQVAPGWRERLLAAMARLNAAVDPQTGEVVPGVELVEGDPYLTIRPTQEARDRMRTVLANAGLLQLEAPDAAS